MKAAVTVRDAAERYGVEPNHYGMTLCPFHNDHHPSLFIADDHYHCFACGEHGDVIDFAAKLFGCRLYDAAQKLAADFGIPTDGTGQKTTTIPSRIKEAQQFREKERLCFSVCMDYVRLLEEWKLQYAPSTPDDVPDKRFIEACHKLELYEYYVDLLTSGDGYERTELVELLTEGGKLEELQSRVRRLREESAYGLS